MRYGLVIFDCDGVLIDSEHLAVRADVACLAEDGIVLTEDEILERYVGISVAEMVADLEGRSGRRVADDFAIRHAARLRTIFAAELRAMPGIEALIDAVAGKACVASSSTHERLRHALGLVGLYARFAPHIFSASEVRRGKPAPDLFLHAAARMRVAPEDCVVIEDSRAGVEAAVAAGMTVLGFAGGSHCRADHAARLGAAGAAQVFDTMVALRSYLAD
ncbi:MAG TPA: HAD-IA family hydrolase [Stellaceae bacterium]|nr:HAD-IA family hydrolase [Stellaceae bacterium]